MPTGYTAPIEDSDSYTFREYLLRCARAFTPLIMMRDDSLDVEIPEVIDPSDYHAKQLEKLRRELDEITGLEESECDRRARIDYLNAVGYRREAIAKELAIHERYVAMRRKAMAWEPPSPDHEGLWRFMLEQIDLCDKGLGSVERYYAEPIVQTGKKWREEHLGKIRKDIAYHEEQDANDRCRAAERTEWVRLLRESVVESSS